MIERFLPHNTRSQTRTDSQFGHCSQGISTVVEDGESFLCAQLSLVSLSSSGCRVAARSHRTIYSTFYLHQERRKRAISLHLEIKPSPLNLKCVSVGSVVAAQVAHLKQLTGGGGGGGMRRQLQLPLWSMRHSWKGSFTMWHLVRGHL